MSTLLVIDDDRLVLRLIQSAFRDDPQVQVLTAGTAQEGLAVLAEHGADAILLDVMLPDCSGLETFRRLLAMDARLPVIFITVLGTSDTVIEAMKLGAFDYLLKPLDVARVREVTAQAFEVRRLMNVPVRIQGNGESNGDSLIGRTPQMQEVYKAIGRVASQDVTVLILGDSGTGKELVARAIYQHSARAEGPFLAVNCAALTESLLESELFGHERGSFTGATSQRIGKFEQCTGGTIFLDEVGDMSPLMQSKVLRVLQDQQFERVGGTETIRTDVRIIAATNRDLSKMVETGDFREDLFYRLNGFSITIPPLRQRKDDILLLLEWFLNRYRNDLGKDIHGFSPDALDILLNYSWPGNVRQLQSVLQQAMVHATGPVLIAEFLPAELRNRAAGGPESPNAQSPDQSSLLALIEQRLREGSRNLYAEASEFMDQQLLTAVLRRTGGNQSKAAEMLGITRGSLRNKIRALGIRIDRIINVPDVADEAPITSA